MTTIRPATIHVEKSIESGPKTDSQTLQGSIQSTTLTIPATVYASRSGIPTRRANGTRLSTISEMPSISGVAELPAVRARSRPSAMPSPPSTTLRRRRTTGGSGTLRIAAAIVMTLTRHAEKATTISVSSTPSEKAIRRLCHVKANCTCRPASSSSAPNACAIRKTMP